MKITRSTLNIVLIGALGLSLIGVVITAGARKWSWSLSPTRSEPQRPDARVTDTLPPVISSIKGIEVVSAFIDAHGQANIIVINKTGKGITGLAISSGNLMFSDDNGLTQDEPKVLIPAFSTYTFQQPVTNLRVNDPIRISAAFFEDGTDEGELNARRNIHNTRAREKEKRHPDNNRDNGN